MRWHAIGGPLQARGPTEMIRCRHAPASPGRLVAEALPRPVAHAPLPFLPLQQPPGQDRSAIRVVGRPFVSPRVVLAKMQGDAQGRLCWLGPGRHGLDGGVSRAKSNQKLRYCTDVTWWSPVLGANTLNASCRRYKTQSSQDVVKFSMCTIICISHIMN